MRIGGWGNWHGSNAADNKNAKWKEDDYQESPQSPCPPKLAGLQKSEGAFGRGEQRGQGLSLKVQAGGHHREERRTCSPSVTFGDPQTKERKRAHILPAADKEGSHFILTLSSLSERESLKMLLSVHREHCIAGQDRL